MELIYMGEKYARETDMAMGPFCDSQTGKNWRWADVQCALQLGVPMHIRPVTSEELAVVEAVAAVAKAKATASLITSEGAG